ncbi:MAG: glycosyltransferase [Betaproteobacteria bacterium]|nr:glycosyltransferase [Betaproteobacteria bacterium]MCL2886294.1 glycosyltransferase [Betaproteobacteria bacterium]
MPDAISRVFIAGAGLRGSGYPNAWNTIQMLRTLENVRIIECGRWLPESTRLWKIAGKSRFTGLFFFLRLLSANALSAIRLLLRGHNRSIAYIPYPGLFILWLLSWLPGRWRPRCVCDAYITIWDTLYQDRNLGNAASRTARLLLHFESRALRAAELVLVDTQANAEHVSRLFKIPRERIRALPLALDASTWTPPSSHSNTRGNNIIRVLFIGTFVPLQGATLIAQAIDALRGHDNLEFVLIGDGQQAEEAARWLQDNPAVTWLRDWQPAQVLAEHLAQADICLGIFGGEGKASRVLPFKLYMALAAGKAIITQQHYSLPDDTPPLPALCIPTDTQALADAILALASDPERREQLGEEAARYYHQYLSPAVLRQRWCRLLTRRYRDT